MTRSLIVPIVNVFAKGGFSVSVKVSGSQRPLNLIIDTGSSTLVVDANTISFDAVTATTIAQHVGYGVGDWLGPVVKDTINIGEHTHSINLSDVHLALAVHKQENTFLDADGLLGLAYRELNIAHNLTGLLRQLNIFPLASYPWPKALHQETIQRVKQQLLASPKTEIIPYFDALQEQHSVANQFGIIVHRSSIYQSHNKQTHQELTQHPLNTGLLVLGNPYSQAHLHQSEYISVPVVHDKYYNVEIASVYVEGHPPIAFPQLSEKHKNTYISNGIIDTGASAVVLPQSVFSDLLTQLTEHNTDFAQVLSPFHLFQGKEVGIPIEKVEFCDWPDIIIELNTATNSTVSVKMHPTTYWQIHAPEPNLISFKIITLPDWPNQGILGLPLLNNYYTVFDREAHHMGEIHFVRKCFSPHLWSESEHRDLDSLNQHFHDNKHIVK